MKSRADAVIQGLYRRLWPLCFDGVPGCVSARLEVEISEDYSTYSHERNLISMRIAGWGLDEIAEETVEAFFPEQVGEWKSWHRDLVEEMSHEYQAKVLAGRATEEGQRLHRLFWCHCEPPRKHGPDFFTAVAHVARCLRVDPEDVARELTGKSLGGECPPPPKVY